MTRGKYKDKSSNKKKPRKPMEDDRFLQDLEDKLSKPVPWWWLIIGRARYQNLRALALYLIKTIKTLKRKTHYVTKAKEDYGKKPL